MKLYLLIFVLLFGTLTTFNTGFGQQPLQDTITVDPFSITSFTADRASYVAGEDVTLAWNVQGIADVTISGLGSQPLVGSLIVNPTDSEEYILTAAWEGVVHQAVVTVDVVRNLTIQASFSPDVINLDPSGLVDGCCFSVYFFWTGPKRNMEYLEFSLGTPDNGVYWVGSVQFFDNASNLGGHYEWRIYGTCFSPTNTAFAKVTLFIPNFSAIGAGQLRIIGNPNGSFPNNPGYLDCSGGEHDVVAGPPLSLIPSVSGVTSVPKNSTQLVRIHPNPFNPRTSIDLLLRGEGGATLEVYDLAGRFVRSLPIPQGQNGPLVVTWDGTNQHGREAASGVYFFRLSEAGIHQVKRAVLVR